MIFAELMVVVHQTALALTIVIIVAVVATMDELMIVVSFAAMVLSTIQDRTISAAERGAVLTRVAERLMKTRSVLQPMVILIAVVLRITTLEELV